MAGLSLLVGNSVGVKLLQLVGEDVSPGVIVIAEGELWGLELIEKLS